MLTVLFGYCRATWSPKHDLVQRSSKEVVPTTRWTAKPSANTAEVNEGTAPLTILKGEVDIQRDADAW